MAVVRWTQRAEAERRHAIAAVYEQSPHAGANLLRRIQKTADLLVTYPRLGHHEHERDLYILIVLRTPYSLVYTVVPATPEVLAIVELRDNRRARR